MYDKDKIKFDAYVDIICDEFGIERELLYVGGRYTAIKDCRIVAWSISRKRLPRVTQQELAEEFGLVNHATVISGIKRVNNYLDTEPEFRGMYDKINLLCGYVDTYIDKYNVKYAPIGIKQAIRDDLKRALDMDSIEDIKSLIASILPLI